MLIWSWILDIRIAWVERRCISPVAVRHTIMGTSRSFVNTSSQQQISNVAGYLDSIP